MRVACFDLYRVGVIDDDDTVHDLTELFPDLASDAAAPYRMNALIERWDAVRPEAETRLGAAGGTPLGDVRLRAPSPRPRNVLAAPVNFQAHGAELSGTPLASGAGTARELGFFVKAGGSISGQEDGVELPAIEGRRFDHEGEIAIVIGSRAAGVDWDRALDHVFGYTLMLDATMRMTETLREERTLRKSFTTFGASGPVIVTADEIPDPSKLHVRLSINGDVRQDAPLTDLIVDVPGLIALGASVLVLEPGDIIATGTPAGIGPIVPGDAIVIESAPIGRLELDVRARAW